MPPPSEAIQRYEIIDRCLTNPYKDFPTIEQLQFNITRELGKKVSFETIQKDIAQMKKPRKEGGYGAPIKFKRSNNGYYYDFNEQPDFTIRQFGLNEKNLEVMELAAGVLQRFSGIMSSDSYNSALHNLYASLNIEKTSKDNKLKNAILPQETGHLRGMEHFELFVNAIKKEIPVSFVHYSYKKKRFKTLIVHPYLLKESIDRWYVVGYSEDPEHTHDEFRFFGLDRIYDPVVIERKFKPCNDANELRGIFKNKIGISTINNKHTTPEEITLFVSREMANYVKTLPIHPSQVHEDLYSTGDIKITLQLIPTIELITLILSYGEHMQVIKPEWLKKEIKKKLQTTLNKYS